MCKRRANSGASKMSDAHTVKIDRSAFARGVEEVMTLRPLRDAVSGSVSV